MREHPFCMRCGESTRVTIMSRFNTEILCLACRGDEKLAPGYAAAEQAELQQVRAGNLNYQGVGLSAEDSAFLAAKRAARGQEESAPS